MAYSNDVRNKAITLRREGYSLNELSEQFKIAKSTISLWVRDLILDKEARQRLLNIAKRGRLMGAKRRHEIVRAKEIHYLKDAQKELQSSPNYEKIICAMIYWCEGGKNAKYGVVFTNSDPKLVRTFLKLLRRNFILDEHRFHPCVHLHSYHSPETQLDFWSKVTDIDKQQFIKPYLKPNTGKRIRENYQGCISLRYANNDLARQLMAIAKAYLD